MMHAEKRAPIIGYEARPLPHLKPSKVSSRNFIWGGRGVWHFHIQCLLHGEVTSRKKTYSRISRVAFGIHRLSHRAEPSRGCRAPIRLVREKCCREKRPRGKPYSTTPAGAILVRVPQPRAGMTRTYICSYPSKLTM